ncbi:MAG: tRNA glutamyl-Q(34) synthetase GluQRS [Planctomycetota bacterium]
MNRGRLAPSPTGAQHLGNARTHLVAFWAARKFDSELVLRIDDLDSPRVKEWATRQAVEDLSWLGISWDGPIRKQSENLSHYEQALRTLKNDPRDLVFPCYCTRKEVESAMSAPHESRFRGELPPYPGTCSQYRLGDPIKAQDHCWRFRASKTQRQFDDQLLGPITCIPSKELGDFPITHKSGQAAYQLAVVIDDRLQEVDEVVRGNDLVASTFRQLDLHSALQIEPPSYAHVPLVRGLDGRRLAKRHGDTRLSYYRDRGIAPEAIVGWAAHSLGIIESMEKCSAIELIDEFCWDKLVSEDTLIDPQHLFGC